MSGKVKRHDRVKFDNSRSFNPPNINVGPAGIPKPEYTPGRDHIHDYLAFKDKWIAYVTTNFDSEFESIVLSS